MEAESLRVKNFKCIDNTGWVDVHDLNCFIGKNQSGKTAILEAVNKLNPAFGDDEFEPYEEYPRDDWTTYQERHDSDPDDVISVKFELSPEEIGIIEDEFGGGIVESPKVKVTKNYKNNYDWDIQLDESVHIANVLESYDFPDQTEDKLLSSSTITELAENIEESDSQEQSALNSILSDIEQGELDLATKVGSSVLQHELPLFQYMGEYHFLDDEISMNELVSKQNSGSLDPGDEVFLALLSIGNLDATELRDKDDWTRIRTKLEAAANRVTDKVLEYWNQNQNIEISFDRNYATSNIFGFHQERVVDVLVRNTDYRATIPFGQQSRGFRWFFSVFCHFTDLKNKDRDLVLLLDEPGLHLHAKAQKDFLEFLNQELSDEHQVVYTTHSPFMIEPRNLHRAKMVVSNPGQSTNVSTDVMRTDEDTRFPLQSVFEFDLVDTLLIRPQTLLVEGKSDHKYIYSMSEVLEDRDREGLSRSWTVIPVGSGSNVPTFVSLFGGNDLDLSVLIDGDGDADQRKKQIESRGVMDTDNVRVVTDFTDEDHGDIEDLFSESFYMELVNRAYAGELASNPDVPNRLSASDFKDDNQNPRIVKRLELYFERFHVNDGIFEHNRPAKYLENHRAEMMEEIDEESLTHFEEMCSEFNEIIEDFD